MNKKAVLYTQLHAHTHTHTHRNTHTQWAITQSQKRMKSCYLQHYGWTFEEMSLAK